MKAVLISIQPKWCELIASGKKTIEVRKTKPKLGLPFKVYIYCTKPKMKLKYVFHKEDYPEYMRPDKTLFCKIPDESSLFCREQNWNGKVIGEFVCKFFVNERDSLFNIMSGMSDAEITAYGALKTLYGWHISDLVIYDKPKGLNQFKRWVDRSRETRFFEDMLSLQMPPQSWCYVEELT